MFDMRFLEFREEEQHKYLYNQVDNSCYELRYGISEQTLFENFTRKVRWISVQPVLSIHQKSSLNSNHNNHSILAMSQVILRDSDLTILKEFTEVDVNFVGPVIIVKRVS